MKKVVELVAATFVCLLFIGCGGGGGGGDDGGKPTPTSPSISFADLEGKFPAFPGGTANIYGIIKERQHNISQNAFDDFNTSVLMSNNYAFNSTSNSYSRTDTSTQIKYLANYNSTASTLAVSIQGTNSASSALSDDVFNDEFDGINATLTTALLLVRYSDNISSQYDDYAMNSPYLPSKGFNTCTKGASTNNRWQCTKEDNKFTYVWQENDDFSFYYGAVVK
jgi:hypothetical protein